MGAPLHRADGSATYSANGYTVVGAVNGPIEVQRRDEIPEEAAIEVNVRPAVGVASTKERHLESIIHSTLKRIILTRNFPRTLIQVTLQVISMPDESAGKVVGISPKSTLPLLPALLQAALLALMSGSIPLETTYASASASTSSSFHVFTFTSNEELLVAESEGDFSFQEWEKLQASAKKECAQTIATLRSAPRG